MGASSDQAAPEAGEAASAVRTGRTLLLAFIAANALKLTLFGCIVARATPSQAAYKLATSSLLAVMLWLLLVRLPHRWPVVLVWLGQAGFLAANLLYFGAFGRHIKLGQYLGLLHEGTAVLTHSAVPMDWRALVAVLDLPLFVALVARLPEVAATVRARAFLRRAPLAAAAGLILVFGWMGARGESIHFLLSDMWSGETRVVKRYGVLVSNALDAYVLLDERQLLRNLKPGAPISSSGTAGPHPSFLLIQVESLGANVVNARFGDAYVMPFLHGLAQRSCYNRYALTYHGAGGSSDAEFAVLNGMPPLSDFPSMKLRNYEFPESLVKPLVAAGYSAVGFHGNYGSFYNRDIAFREMGFSRFYDRLAMHLPEAGWGATDHAVFGFVTSYLRRQERPFVDYVITMSSHEPFELVPRYYIDPRFDSIEDTSLRDYFTSMAYVDKQLEAFLRQDSPLLKDTYVIIFGDHSPMFHPAGYHRASYAIEGRTMEFVPLIIVTPTGATCHHDSEAATLLDVLPTVLESSGVPFSAHAYGRDLLRESSTGAPLIVQGRRFDRRTVREVIDGENSRAQ